ncbi:MAG TPA: cytochrome-c peroxidase [Chromatiaceae bacterium]|nr:cytochrome-c peroxidase [Chromatiaceae bacterium]
MTTKTSFTLHTLASTLLLVSLGSQAAGFAISDDDFPPRNEAREKLGKFLMFDKILSGNKNDSCATCHSPLTGLTDWLALPVGEGGAGLGPYRNTGTGAAAIKERVPRNAPHVFNLGAHEFDKMFLDGRVAKDPNAPSGFATPAGDDLPAGLDSALAAQAMFPVTSPTEMAGQAGENSIADATAAGNLAGPDGVWEQLAKRLREIPEYVDLFKAAFDDINTAEDISYVHAANAIAAFESAAWRCTDSPFDRYLQKYDAGEDPTSAVSPDALQGGILFYTKAGCASCHSGKFLTDQQFHAIGVPQIGPGKGDNQAGYSDGHDDFGREQVSGDSADRYKFRTPSLRQVAQTGPWGHDGAFSTLEGMVRHHLDAVASLNSYDPSQLKLPSRTDLNAQDLVVQNDATRRKGIEDAIEIAPVSLSDKEVSQIVTFLHALTDQSCIDLSSTVPNRVPSGLAVFD